MKNLIAMTRADGRFTTLVRALTAAGMIETLSGSGPFTLFAPPNEAFYQLPDGLMAGLLRHDARSILTDLMTYHTVAGKSLKADLRDGQTLRSIQGEPLHIGLESGRICVNNISVIEEIEAANGFVYVIAAVLLPPAFDLSGGRQPLPKSPPAK